jgi:hypothetical protein
LLWLRLVDWLRPPASPTVACSHRAVDKQHCELMGGMEDRARTIYDSAAVATATPPPRGFRLCAD